MTMNRAYSLLEIKGVDDDTRTITGIASTPSTDRAGDIVLPEGAVFNLPLPLLWQHRSTEPIGHVIQAKVTAKGIEIVATIAKDVTDDIEKAWKLIKAGLVRGLSIGFRGIDTEQIPNSWGMIYQKWEWLELSAVTIPAQAEASITSVKQFDTNAPAATGETGRRPNDPPATGKSFNVNLKPLEGTKMTTIAEQITALETKRAANVARMNEVMTKSIAEARSTDQAEQEDFDTLEQEVAAIDADLKRLRAVEKMNAVSAKPVNAATSVDAAAAVRSTGLAPVAVKASVAKGTAFTRFAMALMAGKGNLMQSAEIAKRWADQTPEVETVLKAAVAAGTTTDAAWAKPLVEYQNMASEFAELLRPATIIGRIPGLRNVPFNIKVPRQTGGSSAQWVGEGAPKPVSALGFDQILLGTTKLAGIVVMTDELVRASSPSAEAIVRQDLINTIVQTMDRDFVDPANAGTATVKPASITNGVTPVVASGTTADHVRADVKALFGKFLTANMSLTGAVWIMTEMRALSFALMLNPLGQREFPDININGDSGGTFMGLPVVLSENIPANPGAGDPLVGAGDRIILAKANEILLADDGETLLDASSQASLQMDSAPTNPPVAATVLVSLWQMNLVGIRAERYINWAKRRPGAVQYIDSAAYVG
ncbi:phage major capsid protein [Devosia limi]|uniref:Phage prohead protease, HK97 family/phage major capsid protein, HK97 family,TIGR01554 n=2 Tax=Devosia limi DSM 17137 TaxID=1121477 RepID=A0A1M4X431_9HYPH|nr:phage major capsid protein [Devosia limi]SHE88123.1 phage prohead protease, HK97 family/phage major capsid protein, HK97 family,TIGR01554 [Devosia limi DSM 17137]